MNTDFTENFVRSPGKLNQKPALVLNADYRPLSYFPLSLWSWQDAVKAAYLDRVNIVAEYDDIVHSPSVNIKIPSVIVLKNYVKPSTSTAFTRQGGPAQPSQCPTSELPRLWLQCRFMSETTQVFLRHAHVTLFYSGRKMILISEVVA